MEAFEVDRFALARARCGYGAGDDGGGASGLPGIAKMMFLIDVLLRIIIGST